MERRHEPQAALFARSSVSLAGNSFAVGGQSEAANGPSQPPRGRRTAAPGVSWGRQLVIATQEALHVLDIKPLTPAREAHEISEHHRNDPPLPPLAAPNG